MMDEDIRTLLRNVVDSVPERYGALERVQRDGTRRRRHRRLAGGGAIVASALLVVAAMGTLVGGRLGEQRVPVAGRASVRTLTLVRGYEVPVDPRAMVHEGWMVYRGLPGPAPRFDTTGLGVEQPLGALPLDDLPLPPWGSGDGVPGGRVLLLGSIGGTVVGIDFTQEEGTPAVLVACAFGATGRFPSELVGGCGGVGVGRPWSMFLDEPPLGSVVTWGPLPPTASVVALQSEEGPNLWQRVVGRTAFFADPDGACFDVATLIVFDASGEILLTATVSPVGPCRVTP